jgi:[protein-PII] uridylyltransferase
VFDNRSSPGHTVVDVACGDRIGLLYALATALVSEGLDIHFAKISTVSGMATDVFYVTTADKQRVEDDGSVERVRRRLMDVARDLQEQKR